MKQDLEPRDIHIPTTPMRLFVRNQHMPLGPFYVLPDPSADGEDPAEISYEEIDALAQIIYSTYLEYQEKGGFPDSPSTESVTCTD